MIPSPDRVCTACNVPKPPCCFDYAGSRGEVCQPCFGIANRRRHVAYQNSPAGRATERRRREKMISTDPARYADGIAKAVGQ